MAIVLPELAPKHVRETRLSFLDTRIDPTSGTPVLGLIGDDNESLTREIGWDVSSTKVVTGRVAVSATRSEETMTVEPFFVRRDEPMGLLLMYFDETRAELDDVRRLYYEVKLDDNDNVLSAFKMWSWVTYTSVGGDANDGDAIPFELTYDTIRVPQQFDINTMTFSDV